MGGGNYGSGSANGSILSRGYGYLIVNANNMFDLYYDSIYVPWTHKVVMPREIPAGAILDNDVIYGPQAIIDMSAVLDLTTLLPKPEYYMIKGLN